MALATDPGREPPILVRMAKGVRNVALVQLAWLPTPMCWGFLSPKPYNPEP